MVLITARLLAVDLSATIKVHAKVCTFQIVELFGNVLFSSCIHHVKKKSRFIDTLRIIAVGGTGGNGYPRYGGVGGKGGDVYVQAVERLKDLTQLQNKYPDKRFTAGNGEDSKKYQLMGAAGRNCMVPVPVGVQVRTDSGRVLGEVDKVGDTVLVAVGGRGGLPNNQYNGMRGQAQSLKLDMKLIADIGFVGYPNAGKSTLLKAISRASPKIANYPFTTISPNIAVVEYPDFREIKCADLPGLIEGAHANFGLGHQFLKHVERTELLLFIIDVNGFQLGPNAPHRSPIETLVYLSKELELYDEMLLEKPAMLCITKVDSADENKKYKAFTEDYEKLKIGNLENIKIDADSLPDNVIQFDDIIPISSKTAFIIPFLRERMRELIDFHHEEQLESTGKVKSFSSISKSDTKVQKVDDVRLV